jgi:CcmD family protein
MRWQALGGVAVVAGLVLEVLDVGGERGIGTALAAIGVVIFAYAFVTERERRKLERRLAAKKPDLDTHKKS